MRILVVEDEPKIAGFLARGLAGEGHRVDVAADPEAARLVADPVAGVTPLAACIPLASATLTGPVALGTFALGGLVVLLVTTALARHLSRGAWRAVHASAFGTFFRGLYLVTTALIVAAVIQRLLLARRANHPQGDRT